VTKKRRIRNAFIDDEADDDEEDEEEEEDDQLNEEGGRISQGTYTLIFTSNSGSRTQRFSRFIFWEWPKS
jgi:hypothetical protein